MEQSQVCIYQCCVATANLPGCLAAWLRPFRLVTSASIRTRPVRMTARLLTVGVASSSLYVSVAPRQRVDRLQHATVVAGLSIKLRRKDHQTRLQTPRQDLPSQTAHAPWTTKCGWSKRERLRFERAVYGNVRGTDHNSTAARTSKAAFDVSTAMGLSSTPFFWVTVPTRTKRPSCRTPDGWNLVDSGATFPELAVKIRSAYLFSRQATPASRIFPPLDARTLGIAPA